MSVAESLIQITKNTVRLRAVSLHFFLSVLLASIVASVVFLTWFPANLSDLAGGQKIFWTIVSADVVCGPLLTWLLIRPEKTRLALGVDFTLIALIQIVAMSYGIYSLAHARPLAFVFEVDRFRLVTYADIPSTDLAHLPEWAQPWRLQRPRMLGVRSPASPEERLNSFNDALQGVEISQRPQRWEDFRFNAREVRARSQTLSKLRQYRAAQLPAIDRAVAEAIANIERGETMDPAALIWLPLVSRNSLDWIVILDPNTLRIRAYARVDGFI